MPSTTYQSLQLLGIPRSLHRDLGSTAIDLPKVFRRKLDRRGADVLFQPRGLRRTGDRDDPRLLGEQPRERDLSRGRLLPFGDLAEQINQGVIRFSSLRREARNDVAKVGTVERSVFVDLSGEEALTKRTEWNEADSKFLERRQYLLPGRSSSDCCDSPCRR